MQINEITAVNSKRGVDMPPVKLSNYIQRAFFYDRKVRKSINNMQITTIDRIYYTLIHLYKVNDSDIQAATIEPFYDDLFFICNDIKKDTYWHIFIGPRGGLCKWHRSPLSKYAREIKGAPALEPENRLYT